MGFCTSNCKGCFYYFWGLMRVFKTVSTLIFDCNFVCFRGWLICLLVIGVGRKALDIIKFDIPNYSVVSQQKPVTLR